MQLFLDATVVARHNDRRASLIIARIAAARRRPPSEQGHPIMTFIQRARRALASAKVLTRLTVACAVLPVAAATAQQPPGQNAVQDPGQANLAAIGGAAVGGPGAAVFGGGGLGAGGAANADFDSLIDLITSTVEVDTWQENGTGSGDIQPFPTGVWVDAAGALRIGAGSNRSDALARIARRRAPDGAVASASPGTSATMAEAPRASLRSSPGRPDRRDADQPVANPRAESELRFVSLPRLESEIARRQAAHERLDPAMLTLAGMQRIEFVVVYPDTGDLVVAGPAGDWRAERGALVSAATGAPLVRLDDLLLLLRRRAAEGRTAFGCQIVPRQEGLAAVQDYLARTAGESLPAGGRGQWLTDLREALGPQDVEFLQLQADNRVARLILAADFHMKLIGMGLAKGVPGVPSYLATVRLGPDGRPPAMTVIRWWFSMPTSRVEASTDGRAFALPETCVEVLSENELLAARGERIHTNESDDLTAGFARAFTEHFEDLAAKYPVYGELHRVFELALALAVMEQQQLFEQADWRPDHFLNAEALRLPRVGTPRTVETVVNHRVIARRHVIAGVSGGVWLDPARQMQLATDDVRVARVAKKSSAAPAPAAADAEIRWWWD